MTQIKTDPQSLTGPEKAAIFLMIMGVEYAASIFETMSEPEIRKIAELMSEIAEISPEVQSAVIEEFLTDFESDGKLMIEGNTFFKNVLGKYMEKDKAAKIINDLENKKLEQPFLWCQNIDTSALASQVIGEHPQTIAMILSYMPSEIASEIMAAVPDEKKGDIGLRIAQLGQIPGEIVRDIDQALKNSMGDKQGAGKIKAGGMQALVDILNDADKATEDIVMETIEETNEDMSKAIRKMMFIFEDLLSIDDRGIREILKKVETSQLVIALRTASEEMKQKMLSNLSSRAAEMLKEDMEVATPVRVSEIESAQQEIIRAAKELEAEGTITLGGGKDDELV